MLDPARTPVIIGVGQRSDRQPDVDFPVPPIDLIADVIERAAVDAGGVGLGGVDTLVNIPVGHWNAENQPGALAARVGATAARPVLTNNGGEVGVAAANWVAQRIADGESSLAVLAGANVMRSTELAGRRGQTLTWDEDVPGTPEQFGVPRSTTPALDMGLPVELSAGMESPPTVYPLFENALRHHFGRTLDEHLAVVGRLMARFTDVAAANPHAWYPIARTPEELTTPAPTNRMVAYPYTKYLNAILNTNQAGALIIASAEQARALGVPEERWVHWWGGNRSQEEAWHVSTRPDLASTPSILDSHLGAMANAGIGIDDVDLIDFYSCFPSAVEMAAKMLGIDIDDPRGFTVTGGLPYAGGPGSAYTLHSLATMAERLRERPDAIGLVTGNGYYLTKHSASVWSGRPFGGERLASSRTGPQPSEALDTTPLEPQSRDGEGTIETYTVVYGRDGQPQRGVVLGRYDDGARFVANTPTSILADFVTSEQIGRRGRVTAGETVSRFDPH